MTDASAPPPEPTVTIGELPPARKPTFSFLGPDSLNALNICFVLTSVSGAGSEYLGSTFGAVASMLVFLTYGFVFRKDIPNIERFADSAYYQGFILTLFALLLALGGKGAETITSDGIIRQFGLAIWTTFIGMSGRIVIIQFLTTARDQDEQARELIAGYVNELNKEIEATLSQLRVFREAVVSSASKASAELADETKRTRKETNDAVKAAMTALVRSVEQSTVKLDQSVERLTERISNLEIPPDALSGPIHRMADAMADDLTKLRTELDEGARGFASTMRGNVAVLEQTRGDLGILRQSLADINDLISAASKATTESLINTQGNLNASAQAAHGVEQLGKTAEALAQRLTALSGALDDKARSYASELERASAESSAASARANDNIGLLANAVLDGAKKIKEAVQEAER